MSDRLSRSAYTRLVDHIAIELWRCKPGTRSADNIREHVDPKNRGLYRRMARRLIQIQPGLPLAAQCVICGCDDHHACESGCSWIVVNRVTGKGVCSNCVKKKED